MSYLTLLLTHNKDQDGNPHGPFTVAEEEVNTININDLLPAFGSTDDFRGVDPATEAAPFHVEVNRMLMPKLKWSFWTNRSLLALSDGDAIRARLGNQYSMLGSCADMLVTISAASFCYPPTASSDGVCMLLSSMRLIGYIVIALTTVIHPSPSKLSRQQA